MPDDTPVRRQQCVLILDDEENILRSLRRLLRREPYEIVTCTGAERALEELERRKVDLVISDQRMPGVTGTEFLREVRRRWPDAIRVILSGYTEVNTIISAVNEGEIYKFLIKPWNDTEIALEIQRALEQSELDAKTRDGSRQIDRQRREIEELRRSLSHRAPGEESTTDPALLDVLDAGVVLLDGEGRITSINACGRALLESQSSSLVGSSGHAVLPVLPEEIHDAIARGDHDRGCCEMRGRRIQWRLRHWTRDGSVTPLLTLWDEVCVEA